jgi:membrane protein DedA with SNARE-associated domain
MFDILEELLKLSYFGIFLILTGINSIPILMPPSWIVLSTFHVTEPKLNILALAIIGAAGSLLGRIILMQISTHFRVFFSKERISSLDYLHALFKGKRYGYFLASFLYSLSPLPSNVMFITYGIMKARSVGILAGFWIGRVVSYYIMISTSNIILKPFMELFSSHLTGILVTNAVGMLSVVVFTSINWLKLITVRKLELIKPKL